MAEQKAKLSKLCLTGFLLSILAPFAIVLFIRFSSSLDNEAYWIILGLVICLPFIGMILSIAGLVTARNKGRKGKGFGIAGIILPNAYTATIVILVGAFFFMLGSSNMKQSEKEKTSDVYGMGGYGTHVNTQYSVERYMIPRDFDLASFDVPISETELKSYAEKKLDEVTDIDSVRAIGTYQNYKFIIVRSDRFEKWVEDDPLAYYTYSREGYYVVCYSFTWEFSGGGTSTIEVYKDPLDRFVILTNCNDNKVITDFF